MARTTGRPSVMGRAIVAIALFVGFYVLAIVVIAALGAIAYSLWDGDSRFYMRVSVLVAGTALAVFVSTIPRRDHFVAPGPELTAEEHPQLFEVLRDVANATGQEMPSVVYAELDVNAWVAQRGGILGAGSRRMMGLGLPLLGLLTVSEFRAIVAHEFGHYDGQDTRLGAWIHKARSAISITIMSLEQSVIRFVFVGYSRLFLRVTQSISRRQEYAADALAARVVGAAPLISGLQKSHAGTEAFHAFMQHEFLPVLAAGYLPSMSEGLDRFMRHERVTELMEQSISREMERPRLEIYDSHPPLAHRVAALENAPTAEEPTDTRPAIGLLADRGAVERATWTHENRDAKARPPEPMAWDDVAEKVHLEVWRSVRDASGGVLDGILLDRLPMTWEAQKEIAIRTSKARFSSPKVAIQQGRHILACALTVRLVELGFKVRSGVLGETVSVERGSVVVEPFEVLEALESGELTAAEWERRCMDMHLGGLLLRNRDR